MKLPYAHTNKTTSTDFTLSLRRTVLTFINQHAGVFEALARQQTPFGGSLLANDR
ncbi:hypothetical protein [Spirosoma aerophilum]